MLVLYSSEFINGNYIGRTLNPRKAYLCRIGSGVGDINDALNWFLYPGCYSFLLNRILAPEDLALKTLHAFQTLSLMTFNVSVLQASQERPVLLVSMLVRSSNEVDEDRFIPLGVVVLLMSLKKGFDGWANGREGQSFPENLSKLEVLTVNGYPQSTPSSLLASSSQA